ncbi:MAG: LysR family transcriptional regulator [Ramlibacter sp.]|nr:LysR family transcriptional regulator [Ramlibacter sp.]MDB5912088.1 LysR family transcriptional regulator [Ramlibacter sp.]
MDITLARTFLEIAAHGSFAAAADRLHVTQTAVGARVRTLEELVGSALFVRNKAGATLTVAGEKFLPFASTLVQVWERARHELAVPSGRRGVIVVGCEVSLWDPLLLAWLQYMQKHAPDLAVRAEVSSSKELLEHISNGTVDIAIVYAPHQRPGLRIELLIEEKLVLVTTDPASEPLDPARYVYVDWGPEFSKQHALAFPDLAGVGVSANLGPLAREYLLASGGAGYFRLDVVRKHLDDGRLHRVPGTPEFLYPAYAVYAQHADAKIVLPALEGLRHAAASDGHRPARTRRIHGLLGP